MGVGGGGWGWGGGEKREKGVETTFHNTDFDLLLEKGQNKGRKLLIMLIC